MKLQDIEISVYSGVRDTRGRRSTLHDFLTNVDLDKINLLRSCPDADIRKKIKLSLPQATVSGVFAPTRSAENLVMHSGLICVDIDRKDNLHLANFDTLLSDVICHLEEVMYAAHSVSGNGYFLIIPLKYPARHKAHFEQLIRVFDRMGIKIDRACADVCRLRCQSYDPRPYINPDAKPFAGIYRQPKPRPRFQYDSYGLNDRDDEAKVARLCKEIAQRHIDLTATYDDWMRIGASLANLGENGRRWFHLCSSQNGSYRPADCDRKFTNLLRSTPRASRRITLGTFFHACRKFGLALHEFFL